MKYIHICTIMLVLAGCVATQTTQRHTHAKALEEVTVPEFEVRDAAMSDVMDYVSVFGPGCIGHSALHLRQDVADSSVTYTLLLCPHDLHDEGSPPCIFQGKPEPEIRTFGPAITLTASNIGVLDLVKKIAEQSKGSLEIKTDRIIVRTEKVEQVVAPVQNGSAPDPF